MEEKTDFAKRMKILKILIPTLVVGGIIFFALPFIGLTLLGESDGEDVDPNNYRELCRHNKYEEAHKVLDKLYQDYLNAKNEYREEYTGYHRKEKETCREAQAYTEALDYIFKAEALYLFSLNDSIAESKITYLLTEIPQKGTEPTAGTGWSKDEYSLGYEPAFSYQLYKKWVSDYNQKCTQLLDLAISNNKKEVAKKILALYKDEISHGGYGACEHTTKSKDAAKEKYQEAFGE